MFSSNCSLQSNEDLYSHLYMKFFFQTLFTIAPNCKHLHVLQWVSG